MASRLLPNLFVIGAPKCGTNSLHHYLGLHPEVEMTVLKEPQLFADPAYPRSLRRYTQLFEATDTPVRGESSVVYSQHPNWPGIPERIHEHVPDARFIYLVRDPVERAVAHWRQHVQDGKERRPLAEALDDFERPDSTYLTPSRYATQLRRYLRHFDRERFLVLGSESLRNDREHALERIFRFIGVDPGFRSIGFELELNTRRDLRSLTRLGRLARWTGLRRVPLPTAVRERVRGAISRQVEAGELPSALREEIAGSLADEMSWLRSFAGIELRIGAAGDGAPAVSR